MGTNEETEANRQRGKKKRGEKTETKEHTAVTRDLKREGGARRIVLT